MSLIGTYLTSKHCRECPLSGGKAWFRKSMVIQIVGDRLVDPALEITVARFKKIIALQRAGRRNPMTHENAEDLTANVLVGRSLRHRSTLGFARHRSYAARQQWTSLHNRWATPPSLISIVDEVIE